MYSIILVLTLLLS